MNSEPNQKPAPPGGGSFKTDIVNNIPIHQASAPAPAAKVDDELDKIMQDVGHQLKKEDIKPPKHHLFSKKHQPQANPAHIPMQAQAQPRHHQPQPALAQTQPHQVAPKPSAKSKSTTRVPVFLIVTTIAVTGVLIAAAFAAYK